MVRLGDLSRAGISWSLHSDMPMAPADPLFLMWCATTRMTSSGRIADPGQRVSVEAALRGVTINAAYSLGLEKEVGSIVAGKRANFPILDANPLAVDPKKLRDIKVWGPVMGGRVLAAGQVQRKRKASLPTHPTKRRDDEIESARDALGHTFQVVQSHLWEDDIARNFGRSNKSQEVTT